MTRIYLATFLLLLGGLTVTKADGPNDFLLDWVGKYAQKLNVRFGTRPFEQIGWAEDIGSALKFASKHHRPVFLFTLDGYLDTGRC